MTTELLQKIEIGFTYIFLFVTIWGLAYWIKAGTEKMECPECGSDHIKVKTRRRYLRTAFLCLYLVILSSLMLLALATEDWDNGLTILIGLPIAGVTFLVFIIRGVYFFTKWLIMKETACQCLYCNHKFGVSPSEDSN